MQCLWNAGQHIENSRLGRRARGLTAVRRPLLDLVREGADAGIAAGGS